MRKTVIMCNNCTEILGVPETLNFPTINPQEVFEAEDKQVEKKFEDGWVMTAFPDPTDPIAITIWHQCPDCH